MLYKPCNFTREDYLEHSVIFENIGIDDAENELCEFNNNAEDLAFELAYTRYRLALAESLLAQRDGGAHDSDCSITRDGKKGCNCQHDEVLDFLASRYS